MSLLDINDLCVAFSEGTKVNRAVQHISFSLDSGTTLGIVGESGSGKSVTALTLMGLLPPTAHITKGSIQYQSTQKIIDLRTVSKKERRHINGNEIAMIFQEPMTSLNPVYTCGRQVSEMLRTHEHLSRKKAAERTVTLFEEVRMPRPHEMLKRFPHELSGGQRQRVMIAMAIACKPKILIADEPTTALDVTVQKNILKLLKDLQQKYAMAMLFISHDLGVITQIADHVMVMHKGKAVEQGSVHTILNTPKDPYTKGLIACRPPINARYTKLSTVDDFLQRKTDADHNRNLITKDMRQNRLHEIYLQQPVLRIENLSTHFTENKSIFSNTQRTVKAVDNVNFCVYPGETVGLAGESGCGKTTLGRTILSLIKNTEGKIIYKGQDITGLKGRARKKFRRSAQIIFQDPYSSLNPRLTAGKAITEPMKVHNLYRSEKERKKQALALLNRVGLDNSHYDRYPHEFSGGQRQRICIARALAVKPEFLICDESVSALDVSIQAQVLNLLNEIKKEFNLTFIFISHDLSVVKYVSDKIIIMKNGQITEADEADKLFANPQTSYTKELIDAIPI